MSVPGEKESIVNKTDQEAILNPLTPIQVALMGFLNSIFTSCVDVLVKNWDEYSQLKREYGAYKPLLTFGNTPEFRILDMALHAEDLYKAPSTPTLWPATPTATEPSTESPKEPIPGPGVRASVIQMVFTLAAERVSAQAD